MAIQNILRYPDARLHKVAAPVTVFDESLKRLVADMAETMYAAPGIGLAATRRPRPAAWSGRVSTSATSCGDSRSRASSRPANSAVPAKASRRGAVLRRLA